MPLLPDAAPPTRRSGSTKRRPAQRARNHCAKRPRDVGAAVRRTGWDFITDVEMYPPIELAVCALRPWSTRPTSVAGPCRLPPAFEDAQARGSRRSGRSRSTRLADLPLHRRARRAAVWDVHRARAIERVHRAVAQSAPTETQANFMALTSRASPPTINRRRRAGRCVDQDGLAGDEPGARRASAERASRCSRSSPR